MLFSYMEDDCFYRERAAFSNKNGRVKTLPYYLITVKTLPPPESPFLNDRSFIERPYSLKLEGVFMKRFLCILLSGLILCGCAKTSPDAQLSSTQQSTQQTSQQTTTSETADTEVIDPLQTLLDAMTLEEKVGQLFLARCPARGAVEAIEKYHLGGFVLFGRDVSGQTPDSLTQTVQSYQEAAGIPMLIAVDEEGGTVNRVSSDSAFRARPFPSPRRLFSEGGLDLVLDTEQEKCTLLSALGINVNLAPVCDITTNPKAFMYDRSLGQDPEITGNFIAGVTALYQENQMGSVLKHFPGYGDNTDTHVAIAVDDRPLAELESRDLVPFAAGIEAGCGAIMVSHVYINALDPLMPATLSAPVHQYLREDMGFSGVIITDDLAMAAITDTYGAGEAAILAVLAGNDLLAVSDYAVQYEAVLQAVKDGRISTEQLDTAVYRILKWKQTLGLLPT